MQVVESNCNGVRADNARLARGAAGAEVINLKWPLGDEAGAIRACASWMTPLSKGGDPFEGMTFPSASSDRALFTVPKPADLAKKASSQIGETHPRACAETNKAWQRKFLRSTHLTRL